MGLERWEGRKCRFRLLTVLKFNSVVPRMSESEVTSDYLLARCSFLSGAASAFAFSGNYYEVNLSSTEDEADRRALWSDFAVIGGDIRNAMDTVPSGQAQQMQLPFA